MNNAFGKHVHNYHVANFIKGSLFCEVSPPVWIDDEVMWVCICGEYEFVSYPRTQATDLANEHNTEA